MASAVVDSVEDELTPLPEPGAPLPPFPRPSTEPERSLLKNREDDFHEWLRCSYCYHTMKIPKTLPCLHTICSQCVIKRYQSSRQKFESIEDNKKTQMEKRLPVDDKYDYWHFDGLFSCPVCSFPCYLPLDLRPYDLPTNTKFLRASYKERVLWWHEHCQKVIEYDQQQKQADALAKKKKKKAAKSKKKKSLAAGPEAGAGNADERKTLVDAPQAAGGLEEIDRDEYIGTLPERGRQAGLYMNKDMTIDPNCSDFELQRQAFKPGPEIMDGLIRKYGREKMEKIVAGTLSCFTAKEIGGVLERHWNLVTNACPDLRAESIFQNEDAPNYGSVGATKLGEFEVKHHTDNNYHIFFPSAIAVNPQTGHIVVVDSSMNKVILYKKRPRPFGYKQFEHSVIDVCFYPSSSASEGFYAVGHARNEPGVYLCTVPFNSNPHDFASKFHGNIRDVSGIMIYETKFLCLTTPDTNMLLRQVNDYQFSEVASRKSYGLLYPTHMIYTPQQEIILSDTGNHRIAKFYGPDYGAVDFYGKFGHDRGDFYHPHGIAMDETRRLYVCDSSNYRVQVFLGFLFEDCPIRRTYLIGKSIKQDVKPVDCGINDHQNLVVLYRGKHYAAMLVYKYREPLMVIPDDEPSPTKEPHFCLSCICCSPCCKNSEEDRPSRRDGYLPIA